VLECAAIPLSLALSLSLYLSLSLTYNKTNQRIFLSIWMKVRFKTSLIIPVLLVCQVRLSLVISFSCITPSSNELKSVNKSKHFPQTVKPHRKKSPNFRTVLFQRLPEGSGGKVECLLSPDEKLVFHNDMLFLPCSGDWLHIRICSNEIREGRKTKGKACYPFIAFSVKKWR
jgi:hypothetical protein